MKTMGNDHRCKVCDNAPNEDGTLEHGKGCKEVSELGGGSEYIPDADANGKARKAARELRDNAFERDMLRDRNEHKQAAALADAASNHATQSNVQLRLCCGSALVSFVAPDGTDYSFRVVVCHPADAPHPMESPKGYGFQVHAGDGRLVDVIDPALIPHVRQAFAVLADIAMRTAIAEASRS